MSAFVYGAMIRRYEVLAKTNAVTAEVIATENKLVTAIAALVPVEVIAAHGIVIGFTTTTAGDTTTITNPDLLRTSLLFLVAGAFVLYLAGRNREEWKRIDLIRMLLPPVAALLWMALLPVSALTPCITDWGWNRAAVGVWAALISLFVLALARVVTPPPKVT